jgi:hypothetical protein
MIKWKLLILLPLICSYLLPAQTVRSFEGIDASQLANPRQTIDPNGAVGTKQYMEWVNGYYQAYDKVSFAKVWNSAQAIGSLAWGANASHCSGIGVDTVVLFDRLASRWVIGGHSPEINNHYYSCVAVSNTDDLTASNFTWYTYQFDLTGCIGTNLSGKLYYPDYTKLSTWLDGYYGSIDLEDPSLGYREVGIVAFVLDRTSMLADSTPRPMQCFRNTSSNGNVYLAHSLEPADIDGTTAPPQGRDEFFVSIQNPPNDGQSTTSNTMNLWDFHVDWTNPSNSTFNQSVLSVPTYTPGCYNVANVAYTFCVPEPSFNGSQVHNHIDSVGDRIMWRLAYRNFGSYESFLGSQTIQVGSGSKTILKKQTGISWFELRGSGVPTVYQTGIVDPDQTLYRFMPSIAQDHSANAAVGYSISGPNTHPGIRASWFSLSSPSPTEIALQAGKADEKNSQGWGDYTSMTVDPVDDCTFWYVNEYFTTAQVSALTWRTRISNFKLPGCQ